MKNLLSFFSLGLIFLLSNCQNPSPEETKQNKLALNNSPEEVSAPNPSETNFEIMMDHQLYFTGADNREVYFMARIKGGADTAERDRPPLNISLVLDRSGSMESERKLEKAKEAVLMVLNHLKGEDQYSLVSYDHMVTVDQPSGKIQNKSAVQASVKAIRSGGSTNLSGGMLEGYNQVKSTKIEKAVNRVLLLSDGLANQGITEPTELQKIVQSKFDQESMAISTFGVGSDFNEDLMTNLAEYGRGNYYFIDSPDDIPAIFKKELDGLLSVVAQNAQLTINFPNNQLELEKVYGYEASIIDNEIRIPFNDVFAEEEKVVLVKFRLKDDISGSLNFKGALQYDDVLNGYSRKKEVLELEMKATNDKVAYEESANKEVMKNIVAFTAVQNVEQVALLIDQGKYDEARVLMQENIQFMEDNPLYDIRLDSTLSKQLIDYKDYSKSLEEVEVMEAAERSSMQKANKMKNYQYEKKKRK